MDYESALLELQKFRKKEKQKKLKNKTYLWAEGPDGTPWDENSLGPLDGPVRIHVKLFGTSIITWTRNKNYVELPSGHTGNTTMSRIQLYTNLQLWSMQGCCFVKHPKGKALPYPYADRIDADGLLVDNSDDWLNGYDSYELFKRARTVANKAAHDLVYGKNTLGWSPEWMSRAWGEAEFALASPDLVLAVYRAAKYDVPMSVLTVLGLIEKTEDVRIYRNVILACHPETYKRRWLMRTRKQRVERIARQLTGEEPGHPKERKAAIQTALYDGILSAMRLT